MPQGTTDPQLTLPQPRSPDSTSCPCRLDGMDSGTARTSGSSRSGREARCPKAPQTPNSPSPNHVPREHKLIVRLWHEFEKTSGTARTSGSSRSGREVRCPGHHRPPTHPPQQRSSESTSCPFWNKEWIAGHQEPAEAAGRAVRPRCLRAPQTPKSPSLATFPRPLRAAVVSGGRQRGRLSAAVVRGGRHWRSSAKSKTRQGVVGENTDWKCEP